MGAEDFSYYLLEKPGCYFLIGNGDGTHRDGGHGMGPCMLHNPSYDFNDELIPLGGSLWVRLAEAWLATAPRQRSAAGACSDTARFFAQSYAEARDKFFAAARGARPRRRDPRASAARPRRRDAGDGRRPRRPGRRDARCSSSAAPATASRASAARACRWRCSTTRPGTRPRTTPASPCSTSTAQPVRLFVVAPHDPRERRPEPQLPRLRAPSCRAIARYDEIAAADRARDLAARRRRRRRRSTGFVAEHGEQALQQAISGGQYRHPRRPLLRRRRAHLEPADLAPGAAPARHAAAAQLAWIDLHTGLGPNGHGERIFAGRDDAGGVRAAPGPGGATSPRSTTARRPRRCSPA